MIERVLRIASLDDARYRDAKLHAFRAVLVMGIATGYGLWAWETGDWRRLLIAPLLAAAVASYLGVYPRVALGVTFGCMVVKLASVPLALVPEILANHSYVEFLALAALLALAGGEDDDRELCIQALRWGAVLVFFHAGVQKLWYGTYFEAEYLGWMISMNDRFHSFFGLFMSDHELDRLASFRDWVPQFDRNVLVNALPGPYAVDSILVRLMSNAVWIGEIVFAPMMLIGRTRVIGVIGALAVLFVIEAGAREIVFGVLYTNLLLLFVVRDVNRKLLPVFAALYLLVIVGRTGVLPFEVPL